MVFAFYLENEAFAQELPFLKDVLKLSILPIDSVFIIEFHVGLKVKIAQKYNKQKGFMFIISYLFYI